MRQMRYALLVTLALVACTLPPRNSNLVEERIEYWSAYLQLNPALGANSDDVAAKLAIAGAKCSPQDVLGRIRCLDSWNGTTRSGLVVNLVIWLSVGDDGAVDSVLVESIYKPQ